MRRFLNIGTAFVLVLSCWGSALAAPCPHGCHLPAYSHSHAHNQRSGAEPSGHCHSTAADDAQQSPEISGQEPTDVVTYAADDPAGAQSAGVFGSVRSTCDHCVGRTEVPTSSFTGRELSQTKKGDAADANVVSGRVIHAAGFVKEIVPHDDGPPSTVHRHVLLSVFRI